MLTLHRLATSLPLRDGRTRRVGRNKNSQQHATPCGIPRSQVEQDTVVIHLASVGGRGSERSTDLLQRARRETLRARKLSFSDVIPDLAVVSGVQVHVGKSFHHPSICIRQ
jgi:hypothetical protein